MQIWAIADLHLSGGQDKPMDIFGGHWRDHQAQIAEAWRACVAADDLVLIAGDISWAMRLHEVAADLAWIEALPGRKILSKGNHDYWWSSRSRVRSILPPSIQIVDCDALQVDSVVLCGTRGWLVPGDRDFTEETDRRIYERELGRLERALAGAKLLAQQQLSIVVMLHFPPFREGTPTAFAERIIAAGASACVYGHLHQPDQWAQATNGWVDGVQYWLTACDALSFKPLLLDVAREAE